MLHGRGVGLETSTNSECIPVGRSYLADGLAAAAKIGRPSPPHKTKGEFRMNVVFIINSTKEKIVRAFDSPYKCRQFVNKLKHSKKCTLVSYPIFN